MKKVAYLVHDLWDPAVSRRIRMFQAGGAQVFAAGFRRRDGVPSQLGSLQPFDLGRTADARFIQRSFRVARSSILMMGRLSRALDGADVIVARNLEMLAVAARLQRRLQRRPPLVYECLDIHHLLLDDGVIGWLLRSLERRLSRRCTLLLTSSPDFVRHHFEPARIRTPVELVENKVLIEEPVERHPAIKPPGPPWRIGWFGALRCRRSLDLLASFARSRAGEIEIVIRGRPTSAVFPDFAAEVAAMPFVTFGGAYRNPEDLADLYGAVHFAWAVDFFEEGQNSAWLLPNRLYEGGLHGAVPIAPDGTAVGRFLREREIGFRLGDDVEGSLRHLFEQLTPDLYREQAARLASQPPATWACGRDECEALVARITGAPLARRHRAAA